MRHGSCSAYYLFLLTCSNLGRAWVAPSLSVVTRRPGVAVVCSNAIVGLGLGLGLAVRVWAATRRPPRPCSQLPWAIQQTRALPLRLHPPEFPCRAAFQKARNNGARCENGLEGSRPAQNGDNHLHHQPEHRETDWAFTSLWAPGKIKKHTVEIAAVRPERRGVMVLLVR